MRKENKIREGKSEQSTTITEANKKGPFPIFQS
jgi:hypothetical protein